MGIMRRLHGTRFYFARNAYSEYGLTIDANSPIISHGLRYISEEIYIKKDIL